MIQLSKRLINFNRSMYLDADVDGFQSVEESDLPVQERNMAAAVAYVNEARQYSLSK